MHEFEAQFSTQFQTGYTSESVITYTNASGCIIAMSQGGGSCGVKVLGKVSVLGVLLIWIIVGLGPIALPVDAYAGSTKHSFLPSSKQGVVTYTNAFGCIISMSQRRGRGVRRCGVSFKCWASYQFG